MKNKNRKSAVAALTTAHLGRRVQAYVEQPQTQESAKAATGILVAALSISLLPGKMIVPLFLVGMIIIVHGLKRIFAGVRSDRNEGA